MSVGGRFAPRRFSFGLEVLAAQSSGENPGSRAALRDGGAFLEGLRLGCVGGARPPVGESRDGGPRCEAAADGGGARELLALGRGALRPGAGPGLRNCDCCVCCPVARSRGSGGGGIKEDEEFAGAEGVGCDNGNGGGGIMDSFLDTLSSVVGRGGRKILVWLEGEDFADPFWIGVWLLLLSRSRTGTSSTGAVAADALGVI